MGYEHVAYIKNKYFLPNEDAIFMINDLTDFTDKNINLNKVHQYLKPA